MPQSELRVVVLGSGGVASALAPAIDALEGVTVTQVYSRTFDHARALAERLERAGAVGSTDAVDRDADLYLLSVSDDAVAPLAHSLGELRGRVVAHTSGSVPADALAPLSEDYGVFYPLQTFSPGVPVDVGQVPFFIEGSTPRASDMLGRLARRLSGKVYDADSETRRTLHIAAVFACNFANHLWAIADDILATRNLPFEVLRPLLEETLRKAFAAAPAEGQTGPARRGDRKVIDAHLQRLGGSEAELYRLLSDSISRRYGSL